MVPVPHKNDGSCRLPTEVVNCIDGMIPHQVVKTIDPKLDENYLPLPVKVKYACFAENDRSRYALLELCEQKSIIAVLKMQGPEFRGYRLSVLCIIRRNRLCGRKQRATRRPRTRSKSKF